LSAIQPPAIGPIADPTISTLPANPCQRPRSAAGARSAIVMNASDISAPAPSPWTARAAIRWPMLCAAAPKDPPIRNSTIAARNSRRRP
jgi:hypothetical protein